MEDTPILQSHRNDLFPFLDRKHSCLLVNTTSPFQKANCFQAKSLLKSPHGSILEADSRKDLDTEARIYQHLGEHPRLVRKVGYSPKECLLLEYMPNGSLGEYLRVRNQTVSTEQQLRWACEAAEGLQVLPSKGDVHCDTKPRNSLLDEDLGLRIADFSDSSFNGSRSSACEETRFWLPRDWWEPSTVRSDLFALGSTIYEIMTGNMPYEELPSSEVARLYKTGEFSDLTQTLCGEYIRQCWHGEVHSAQEVYNLIKSFESNTVCNNET